METRNKYNKKILSILDKFFVEHPYIRFGQALYILNILEQDENGNIKDIFNTEPIQTYCNICKHLDIKNLE